VTRDPVAAEAVASGEQDAYEAPIARADLARPAVRDRRIVPDPELGQVAHAIDSLAAFSQ
jgi:hypothetical protein